MGAVSALWQQPVPLVLGWLHWPRGTDRTVAVAADAVTPRPVYARQERDGGEVPAGEVDQRQRALARRPVGLARQAGPAREALHGVVVGALVGPRPG